MNWLQFVFLESTLALGILVFLVSFAMLVAWRRGGSPRPLLISVAVGAVLLIMQAAVETPREIASAHVAAITDGLVKERSLLPLQARLAADFSVQGMDRTEFMEFATEQMGRTRVMWVQPRASSVRESTSDRFVYDARFYHEVIRNDYRGTFSSAWRFAFRRTDSGWKISAVEALELPGTSDMSWKAIGR